MRFIRLIALLGAVCAFASVSYAQDDAEGAKDHPMFSRMPGYFIEDYDYQDFAPLDLETDPSKHVEGRYWTIQYHLKENAKKVGPLQIARNYTDLIVKRGGKKLLEDVDPSGGTTVAQLPVSGGKSLWLQLRIGDGGERYTMYVVEEAGMEQKVEFTADELTRALETTGSVAVHGITFDTGKATIKPESAAVLGTIADVLKKNPDLKLEIQGHTDNVGAAAANLKLSQERAAAVKSHLVQTGGIEGTRMTTAGFGDTKPVAANTTDEGRAQNRRVELVRK